MWVHVPNGGGGHCWCVAAYLNGAPLGGGALSRRLCALESKGADKEKRAKHPHPLPHLHARLHALTPSASLTLFGVPPCTGCTAHTTRATAALIPAAMARRLCVTAIAAGAAVVLAATAATTAGLQTYAASAELEPSVATLHWTLNDSAVQFGLVIADAALVTANASALWLGLGIGEPTSGGMLGADIVTAEFGDGGPTACRLVDRHVPSVAYPLGSTAGGGRGAYPEPDDCGTVPSWGLVACEVEPASGSLTLELSRDLAAGDPAQDRPIVPGRNILLYAYGDGFSYHGARRKSVAVDLTATGAAATGDAGLAASGRLPADATTSQLLTMPDYPIPTNRTEYACASFTLDVPPAVASGRRRQLVAAEAVVDRATAGGAMVHHFLVFECGNGTGGVWDKFSRGPGSCYEEQPNCRTLVWAYVDCGSLDGGREWQEEGEERDGGEKQRLKMGRLRCARTYTRETCSGGD